MVIQKAKPVRLAAGDVVTMRSGTRLTVEEVVTHDGKPQCARFLAPGGARISTPWGFLLTRLARQDWKVAS